MLTTSDRLPLTVTPGTETATLALIWPAIPEESMTRVPLPLDRVTKLADPLPSDALRFVTLIRAATPLASLPALNTKLPLTVCPLRVSVTLSPSISTYGPAAG